jgi:sodium-dependent dicarboxylate transporter 2/3/5
MPTVSSGAAPPAPRDRRMLILLAAAGLLLAIYALPTPPPLERAGNLIPLTPDGKTCLGIMAFAVTLWVTEAMPFAATSLLVVLMIPAFGIADYRAVVRTSFGDPVITFFIGVLILAAAFTQSGLGTRLTYLVLCYVGTSTSRVLLGFLIVGTLISMWITDIAVAAMLLPLGVGLLHDAGLRPGHSNFGRALMIATAFGPLIGGIATPAGTAANLVAIAQLKQLANVDVSFWRWMGLGVPASLLMIPFAWWILLRMFPPELDRLPISADAITDRLRELGPLRGGEIRTLLVFAVVVALWLFTSLPVEAVGLGGGVALFLPGLRVLSWKEAEAQVEWGGIMMIVAGLSLGLAVFDTGAARWLAWVLLGQITSVPDPLRPFVVVLAVAGLHLLFSSNTVTASIIIPILVALASDLHLDSWTTVAPAAFTSSLAFILVSEGPTTIIPYSSGYFSIRDMAKAGILMTVAAAACVAATQYAGRTLALDLRAVHDAPRSRIERVASVHDAPVVPQDEVAGAPPVAPRQRIGGSHVPDAIEQRVRFVERQSLEPRIAAPSEIEMPAAGFRMDADEGMQRAGRGARVVARRDARAEIAAAVVRAVMLDTQRERGGAQRFGLRLPRPVHRAEARVATGGRDLERVERARLRRIGQVRHVGVPHGLAGTEAADGDAVLQDVRHDVDFREPLDEAPAVLLDGRLVERAEAEAERNQIGIGELLAAEQDHGVIEPRLVDLPESPIVNRTEIDALDFGAERGAGRDDLNGANGHGEYAKITDSEQPQPGAVVAGWDDGFFVRSANGDYRLNLGTVLQADGRFSMDDPPPVTNTFSIRKARVVVAGRAVKYFDYRFMPDFGSGSPVILDAYLDLRLSHALRIRAGKDKTPIGYELLIGDTSLLFPERSLASSLVPNRDVGFQGQGDLANGKIYYAGGVFNGVPDGTSSSTDVDANNLKDLAGRLVVHAKGLGFQIGGSHGTEGGVAPSFKTSIGQTWFSYDHAVSALGTRNRVTPSVFYYRGPVGAFAEWVRSAQDVTRATDVTTIANQAWDVSGSYVLTGEPTSDRGVQPSHPFDPESGKWGALQLVARYAELTVDRHAFNGGFAAIDANRRAHQFTLGVNWYPAAVVKYYVNFERTAFQGGYPGSAAVRRPENVIFIRAQLAF